MESGNVQWSKNNKNGSKLSVDTRCCVVQQVRQHVNIVKLIERLAVLYITKPETVKLRGTFNLEVLIFRKLGEINGEP